MYTLCCSESGLTEPHKNIKIFGFNVAKNAVPIRHICPDSSQITVLICPLLTDVELDDWNYF